MKLNFKLLPNESSSDSVVVILHGLFGSLDNWLTVGKNLAKNHTVYLVDQRNHGNSPHSDEFNYPLMANDLLEFISDHRLKGIHLIGHSMGGKTAMFFGVKYAEYLASLVIVDIAPRYYPPHHQEILKGFKAVDPSTLSSRDQAVQRISTVIKHPGIQQFLLKNLQREGQDTFSWKHNLPAIERNIVNIGMEIPQNLSFLGPSLFIAGSLSNYISESDIVDIKNHFPDAEIITISGAGHWVHAEKPAEIVETINEFINSID